MMFNDGQPLSVKYEPPDSGDSAITLVDQGALSELCTEPETVEHSVKEELDIGPYVLQPTDLAYMMMAPVVKLENLNTQIFDGFSHRNHPRQDSKLQNSGSKSSNIRLINTPSEPSTSGKSYFNCDHCSSKYVGLVWLRKHFMKVHAKDKENIMASKFGNDKLNCNPSLNSNHHNCDMVKAKLRSFTKMKIHETELKSAKNLSTRFLEGNAESNLICDCCNIRFKLRDHLKQHLSQMKSSQMFICDLCNNFYMRKFKLINHLRKRHSSNKKIKCRKCPIEFTLYHNMVRHVKLYHSEQPPKIFTCDFCKKGFKLKYALKAHIRVHNGTTRHLQQADIIEVTRFQCMYCSKHFKYKKHLTRHIAFEHSDKKLEECKVCHTKFLTKRGLHKHWVKCSKIPESQDCEICQKTFTRITNLKRHHIILREHVARCSKISESYDCEICQKTFPGITNLKDHYRRCHKPRIRQDIDRKCNICNIVLFGKASLNRHMMTKHLVRTDFLVECNICHTVLVGTSFKRHMTVKHLVRTDLHIKCNKCHPKKCHCVNAQCNLCYSRPKLMNHHMKYGHSLPHPQYSCNRCAETFKCRPDILEHLKKCF